MGDEFHILALSGGGYKGLYSAKVLEEIEKKFNCPVARKFDLISGTSIGGILAIALALEIPAKEIVSLFYDLGKKIFKPHLSFWGIYRSKYSNRGLKEALIEKFGDKKVGDLKHKIIIPTINFTKGGPQVIKTPHHGNFKTDCDKKLVDVALETSAAPTYFPIYSTSYGDFVDGGLVANHPGLYACIEAEKFLKIKREKIYQLHIGTLSGKCASCLGESDLNSGLWQWKTKLIELIFSCQTQSTEQILKFLLEDRYYSIDQTPTESQIRSIGLDQISDNSRKLLTQCANISTQEFFGKEEFHRFNNHNIEKIEPCQLNGSLS